MTFTLENVTVHLGKHVALNGVSAKFAPGRVTAVLGPNGAGKTTLARVLAGLTPVQSGSVLLDANPVSSLPDRKRAQRIGYLAQSIAPAWHVTAHELISLGRLPYLGRLARFTDADHAAVERAMAATDTRHLSDRTIDAMSGGERARVQIARVLAGQPDWIIADEPLANLDPPHQRDVLNLFRVAANAGTGVIIILHQINAAARIADDVVILRDGKIIANGPRETSLTTRTLAAAFDMPFDQNTVGKAHLFTPA
jgi:iron complex transport system ATP-binding protein